MQSTEEARHNAFQDTSRSKIFPFDTPKNVAWELFGFGAESKKFSRHNEKNLVPFFQRIRTKIGAFLVRINESVTCTVVRKNIIYGKNRELTKSDRIIDALFYPAQGYRIGTKVYINIEIRVRTCDLYLS